MRYFDLHCDTAYECACELDGRALDRGGFHLSLERGKEIESWTQVFAIFMPDEEGATAHGDVKAHGGGRPVSVPLRGESAVRHYEKVLGYINKQAELFPGRFGICRSAAGLDDDACLCRAIISVEGGSAAAGSLDRLRKLYDDGVRIMTLTWNADNELGSGVKGSGGGLTPFGRDAVRLMEELGMTVDVSHLSDAGFFDVAKLAEKPFIASHSCSRSLCGHPRNLTDEMFGIIKEHGGLVGINFSRGFLREDENAGAEDIIRHCAHFLERGGEDILCMGSDFDGTDMPDGVTGIESMPALYELFLARGFGRELTDKLFYRNAYDFFAARL